VTPKNQLVTKTVTMAIKRCIYVSSHIANPLIQFLHWILLVVLLFYFILLLRLHKLLPVHGLGVMEGIESTVFLSIIKAGKEPERWQMLHFLCCRCESWLALSKVQKSSVKYR
jgi:hypothetical protein